MRNPDGGKVTRRRRLAATVASCVLVAGCGRAAAVGSDELTTIPDPPPTTTAPSPDPGPTSEQIVAYFDALHEAEAWDFVGKWWWADLGTLIDRLEAAAATPAPSRTIPTRPAPVNIDRAPVNVGGGVPPNAFLACVRNRESHGNYGAVNPSSGAGGAYQFMPSTWRAMGGTGLPQNAPPAVQDAMAQKLYATAGRSPWAGPGC